MNLRKSFKHIALLVFGTVLLAGCLDEDVTPLAVGAKAPPFVLALVDGEKMDMTRPNGSGHVVTFMSSWCPCSNESIPLMKRAHALHKERGIVFLMIGIQDAERQVREVCREMAGSFPRRVRRGQQDRPRLRKSPPRRQRSSSTGRER